MWAVGGGVDAAFGRLTLALTGRAQRSLGKRPVFATPGRPVLPHNCAPTRVQGFSIEAAGMLRVTVCRQPSRMC